MRRNGASDTDLTDEWCTTHDIGAGYPDNVNV